jgi:folylpolyglutamate synthase
MAKIVCLPSALRQAAIAFSLAAPRCTSYHTVRFLATSRTSPSSGRTYTDALALLDKLQSNRSIATSISKSTRDMNQDAIPEMLDWTRRAGYVPQDFAKQGLRCIHVAGTKGKGSVCALIESVLLQYRGDGAGGEPLDSDRKYLGKIGTYTSPHLITVRERIRIDGSPISESLFALYFFELWDRFSTVMPDSDPMSLDTKPGYFRYLTILALHTFLQEGVETAIVECGIGGEYDSTNILPPGAVTVCAITRLGIDHVGMLGETIEEIAWHKAGIMRPSVPVFTIEQIPEAQTALKKRAAEKGVQLEVVKPFQAGEGSKPAVDLAMEGDFQLDNASLGVYVATSHLRTVGITNGVPELQDLAGPFESLPERFRRGLESAKLQGRCEVRKVGNIEWLIDGAHTIDSMQVVGRWFMKRLELACTEERPPTATMLIFNQQDRDAEALIRSLVTTAAEGIRPFHLMLNSDEPPNVRRPQSWLQQASSVFTYAAFCTNTPFKDEVEQEVDLRLQKRMADAYGRWDGNSLHMCYGSIEEAVELATKISEGDERVLVLVTGSLYLVGGLLKVLEKQAKVRS